MLNALQRKKIREDVLAAYKDRYPNWTDVQVTEIVENVYFGTMVAVKAAQCPDGEICEHRKDGVIIFETTPELLRHLDMKAGKIISLRDWLTLVVVLFVLGLFAAVVFHFEKPEAIGLVITSMAGILGTYAGIQMRPTKNSDA